MNREDVAMDVTVQNVEILRGRLEQAEALLREMRTIFSIPPYWHERIDALLALRQGERNQCDGCQAGIPLVDGAHRMGRPGGYPDMMSCQKERYEHPEQADSAQGERDVFESFCTYMLDCTDEANRDFLFNFVQRWETWPDRAALAQPSPAEDMSAAQELAGVKAILNDMADALKRLTFHARTTGGTAGPDAALMNACERAERILSLGGMGAAFMRGCDEHESQPSPAPERSTVYVEARQCDECQHGGINDSADGLAACHDCDWTGPDPAEDKCPGCHSENCMAAACPQCGARYVLVASEEIAAPVAQAGQVPEGVRAWFEAKLAHINAVDAYNARLKFVREHCPFGTSVDPEYQLMEDADRKARSLVGPMFDELRALLAAAPAQGGE